jgi:hypothetical protein
MAGNSNLPYEVMGEVYYKNRQSWSLIHTFMLIRTKIMFKGNPF